MTPGARRRARAALQGVSWLYPYRAREHTVSELEELFAVTRSTVYRAVRRARAAASTAAA
jgi:hypothetical protein